MKKLLAFILSAAAIAAITTGCSATDGDVDAGNGAGAGTTTTTTTRSRTDRSDRSDGHGSSSGEISDDIADGINDGLDKTESVVDDILK